MTLPLGKEIDLCVNSLGPHAIPWLLALVDEKHLDLAMYPKVLVLRRCVPHLPPPSLSRDTFHTPQAIPMAHAAANSSAQHFHDLPTALHGVVASYLHADEALATGATERAMEAIYPASITDAFIQPRLLFEFEEDGEDLSICGWDLYSGRQGASLACLLARLPFLKLLTIYYVYRFVLYHAIFLQPCKQLQSIEFEFVGEDPGGLSDDSGKGTYYPEGPSNPGPSLLPLAMVKDHLPSLEKLKVGYEDDPSVVAEAIRAGHLTRVKELRIESCNWKPLQLRTLLEDLKAHKKKLEKVELELNWSNDLVTGRLMHELLASLVCSELRTLEVSSVDGDDDSSATRFVSGFLRGSGAGGKPSLHELHFKNLYNMEDVSCLADALLLGNGKDSAPNLKTVAFKSGLDENIPQLGSRLFARGALASITTLNFAELNLMKRVCWT